MSNVINIEDLRRDFVLKTTNKDLKDFAVQQQAVIETLLASNKHLEDKLKHLENLLLSLENNNIVSQITPEEMICIEQINGLRSKSSNRELSLDEVKRLDLLVKNLRLIREQSTQVINTKEYTNVKEADLVAIATQTES